MLKTLAISVIVCNSAFAQFDGAARCSRAAAVADAFYGQGGSPWCAFYNPAGLAGLAGPDASCSVSPHRFGLSELSSTSIAVAVPAGAASVGIACARSGCDLFRALDGAIAAGAQAGGFSFGFCLRYLRISIPGYGDAGAVALAAGTLVKCGERVTVGLSGTNLGRATIGEDESPIPQSFTLSAVYSPDSSLGLECDYTQEGGFDPAPHAGVEYAVVDALRIRGGFSQNPPLLCTGFGIGAGSFRFDYAWSSHAELGGTHTVSVSFGRGR